MMEGHRVTDTVEGPENTTMLVPMEEQQRAIRALSYVSKMSFVRAVKDKVQGVLVSLPIQHQAAAAIVADLRDASAPVPHQRNARGVVRCASKWPRSL